MIPYGNALLFRYQSDNWDQAVLTSTQFRTGKKHVRMDMFVQLATTLGTELLLTAELLGALRANMQNPPEMKYKISRDHAEMNPKPAESYRN